MQLRELLQAQSVRTADPLQEYLGAELPVRSLDSIAMFTSLTIKPVSSTVFISQGSYLGYPISYNQYYPKCVLV